MASDMNVSDDLWVAVTAAGCTIALTLAFRFVFRLDVPALPRLTPLLTYVAYLVTRRAVSLGALDTVRNWVGLTVAVTLATVLFYLV